MVILASHFLRSDYEVYLIPFYTYADDVLSLNLDAVLLNYARMNNKDLIRLFAECGTRVFVLDSEGGLLGAKGPRTPEALAKFLSSLNLSKYLSGFFLWGIASLEAYRKYSQLSEDKIEVTGAPRYDVCHERFHGLLYHPYKSHILVNTNFAWINPKFSKGKEVELKSTRQAGFAEDYAAQLFQEFERVFIEMKKELHKIFSQFEEEKFVLRPHPFESEDVYIQEFGEYPNVIIDSTQEIYDHLAGSKYMLHLNCGTSVDANYMEKEAMSLEYLNSDFLRDFVPQPSQISQNKSNHDELVKAMRDFEKSNTEELDKIRREFLVPYFHERDGNNSLRIFKFMSSKVESMKLSGKSQLMTVFSNMKLKSLLRYFLVKIIGSKNYLNWKIKRDPLLSAKIFRQQEVSDYLNALKKSGELSQNFELFQVSKMHTLCVRNIE